jgi:hypothetical protein
MIINGDLTNKERRQNKAIRTRSIHVPVLSANRQNSDNRRPDELQENCSGYSEQD